MTKNPFDTKTVSNPERLYAFDSLRGIMMLLGIVLHAALTYGTLDYTGSWLLKDRDNNFVFDIAVSFIHSFRMPVFFIAAGFFGALLFYKKGANVMIMNRVKRILLPFVAGVFIIYPLVIIAFYFSYFRFNKSTDALGKAVSVIFSGEFLPFNVAHLWFLYFLFLLSVAGWLIALVFRKSTPFTVAFIQLYKIILQNFWLRLVYLVVLFFLCLYWMDSFSIKTNNTWRIDPATFATYFVFFGTGWMLYRTNCVEKLKQHSILQLGIGLLLFLLSDLTTWFENAGVHAQQLIISVYSSLFIFGFIALFLSYFNSFSPKLAYLMDASYWVYIIHLPVVAFVPGLLAGFSLPAVVKFGIVLLVTAIVCLTSYHYLVRSTFIGMFLNGKVHKRKRMITAEKELVLQ